MVEKIDDALNGGDKIFKRNIDEDTNKSDAK
jgi:hypothetical protein